MLDPYLGTESLSVRAESSSELMLAEFAHRVANDMTILMAELRRCRSRSREAEAADVLAAAIERVNNICDVQRRLARPDEGTVDLGVVLGGLAEAIVLARADPRDVDLTLKLPTLRVDSRFAWRLATVVAELLTNALKHGLAGRKGYVLLAIDLSEDILSCTVADDGVGSGDRRTRGTGHGNLIVHALVEEMGGTVERLTSTLGTEVRLSFLRPRDVDWGATGMAIARPWKKETTVSAGIGA